MRQIVIVLTALASAPFGSVASQQAPRPAPGQQVRVTIPSAGLKREVVTLAKVAHDTIVVYRLRESPRWFRSAVIDTVQTRVPLTEVSSLEVRVGGRNQLWLGAGIGAAVGAGSFKVFACPRGAQSGGFLDFCTPGIFAGAVAVGTFAGALVAALISGPHWERVPVDRLSVDLAPSRSGTLALTAQLAF